MVPTRYDTNRPVQSQKQARSLKLRVKVEEILYYLSSENKGADQLCSYCTADLRLCFRLSILLACSCSFSKCLKLQLSVVKFGYLWKDLNLMNEISILIKYTLL